MRGSAFDMYRHSVVNQRISAVNAIYWLHLWYIDPCLDHGYIYGSLVHFNDITAARVDLQN